MSKRGVSLSPAIREQYESIVLSMLIGGATRREIIQFSKGGANSDGSIRGPWNVSDTTIDKYIKKAKEALSKEASIDRQSEIGLVLAQYNLLYRKAMQANDIKTAMFILKNKVELLGLNAPKQVDAKNGGNITIVFDEKFDGIL